MNIKQILNINKHYLENHKELKKEFLLKLKDSKFEDYDFLFEVGKKSLKERDVLATWNKEDIDKLVARLVNHLQDQLTFRESKPNGDFIEYVYAINKSDDLDSFKSALKEIHKHVEKSNYRKFEELPYSKESEILKLIWGITVDGKEDSQPISEYFYNLLKEKGQANPITAFAILKKSAEYELENKLNDNTASIISIESIKKALDQQ